MLSAARYQNSKQTYSLYLQLLTTAILHHQGRQKITVFTAMNHHPLAIKTTLVHKTFNIIPSSSS